MTMTGLEAQLIRELKALRDRFHRCVIRSGTDREFADAAVLGVDQLIKAAEKQGGPGEIKL